VSRETLDAAAKLVWAAVRQYALAEEEPAVGASAIAPAAARPAGEAARVPACFGPAPAIDADWGR
jgi:hypothetical protein